MINERDLLKAEIEQHARMTQNFGGDHVRETPNDLIEAHIRLSLLFKGLTYVGFAWCGVLLGFALFWGGWFWTACFIVQLLLTTYFVYVYEAYRRKGYYGRTGSEA